MHLFFCSLPVSTLHPSPTTTTLAPSLSRQTALGVTAGITCRASGALPPANGLISCGGHPISPEIDSLSFLSSLTRLCPDPSHECRDANAQDRIKKKRSTLVWRVRFCTTAYICVLVHVSFFSGSFPPLDVWRLCLWLFFLWKRDFSLWLGKYCIPSCKIQMQPWKVWQLSRITDLNRNAASVLHFYVFALTLPLS